MFKASMSTLRKRDKKREKLRAEALAKKTRLMEKVVVSGPKRDARRKVKRLITTAVKLAEFKKRAAEKDASKAAAS